MRNIAREDKYNGKVMCSMRNGVRKVTALLRVNGAVPQLAVTLNHYHRLIGRRNINATTMAGTIMLQNYSFQCQHPE